MTKPMPTHGYRFREDITTYEGLLNCFDLDNEDASRGFWVLVGFWALVDMHLPDEKQEDESQLNFSNMFAHLT